MTEASRRELREWHHALTLDPLAAGDPRYVELQDAGRGAVDEIMAEIELHFDATTQLLSGPSGSGKTTELLRLQRELERAGFRVVLLDATRYVNESAPISITEFLVALGLGASEKLHRPEHTKPAFGARLVALLRRLNVSLDVGPLSASISPDAVSVGALGATLEIDIQRELASSRPFVDELRSKLSFHIGQLYDEVAAFVADLIAQTEPEQESAGFVFLVDSLEKLRGASEDDLEVQDSVQRLFVNHASRLKFTSHHTVYTVPTYLQLTTPGALPYDSRVHPVPVPHLTTRDGNIDAAAVEALAELREVVRRRLPVERIFAAEAALDEVIHASGGHLRDLFTLLRQLINLVLRLSVPLPVSDEHIEEAIGNVAHDFSQLTTQQERFLRAVSASDGSVRPEESEVQRMALLLQSHMLLGHLNGTGDWYEVHPLARRALGLP